MKSSMKMPSGQLLSWKDMEYPTVYSNLMGFGMTPFDINLTFGQVGNATTSEVEGLPQVKVILSPEQALNLSKLLELVLNKYVEANGTLRVSGAVNSDAISAQFEANKVHMKVENDTPANK